MSAKNVEIKYTQLFINNEFVNSESGELIPVVNPSTEEVICKIQGAGPKDIDKAVAAAKTAFKFGTAWRTMDASARGKLLYKLADKMEEEIEYLARLETLNNGKSVKSATGDIHLALNTLRYFAGYADKIHGKTIPVDGSFFSYTRHEPVGVVGAIVPWNYPIALIVFKLGPAIACGCTMVIKPSELTPLTALYIGQLTKAVGFPDGVINFVPGYGSTAGAAIVDHKDVNKISFTGSTAVGQKIMAGAGANNLKRVSLELGGKSPLIVFADANLDKAVEYAHEAAMVNHGQCCIAGTRTFVEASIYDKFVEKMKQKAESRIVGDPFKEDTIQGPQINDVQFKKILNHIESGKKEGARLVTGGKRIGTKGYFVEPTVFADVKDDMKIAREEIFGPVQSIFKFNTLKEAVERANDSKYGLGAGVFTQDIDKANTVSQQLQAGTVWVNTYFAMGPHTPFGGYKMSGIGREMSEYALNLFTEIKTVTIAIPEKNS